MLRPGKATGLVLALIAVTPAAFAAEYKPGEVIVKYKEGFRTRLAMNALYESIGVEDVQRYSGVMNGFEQLKFNQAIKVEDVIAELEKNDAVAYAQPNYILHALPLYTEVSQPALDQPRAKTPCWFPGIPFPPGCEDSGTTPTERPPLKEAPAEVSPGVKDPDLDKDYGLAKIQAAEAWAIHKGDRTFLVADIDTGIDYNHEDLAFNLWRNSKPTDKNDVVGFDFIHNDGLPFDDNMHGTHTAGTIAAVNSNGIGASGVAQVSIMSLKFLSGEGSGTTADAIRAIDYAIEHGAKVLSNSWGGKSDPDNQALKEAVERANKKDILFIAAAGNDGANNDDPNPPYPAGFDVENVIAVAATDENDKLAYFSNYGKKSVHVAAPGAKIYSTVPGNQYKVLSGTSMACPRVAGAAALIWSKNPTWTGKKVKEVLMSTVDPIADLGEKVASGGRINLLKAIQAK